MANVVLFHSILGLRPVEREIASAFESDGHRVILPDLFDGQTCDDYDSALAMKKKIGNDAIYERAKAALDNAPDDAVLSGVSFGADLIGAFWGGRPMMPGALLFAGITSWMSPRRVGFPVLAHIARPDPFDDEKYFDDWIGEAGDVNLVVHRYDGVGHYFLDPALSDYGADAAKLCLDRSRSFLRAL
jgi:dienelactone hydrolase